MNELATEYNEFQHTPGRFSLGPSEIRLVSAATPTNWRTLHKRQVGSAKTRCEWRPSAGENVGGRRPVRDGIHQTGGG